MKYPLYLASDSAARKELLTSAQIPFVLIAHGADETVVHRGQPLADIVGQIAQLKMDHVVMPQGMYDGQEVFVLTADTLTLKGSPERFEVFGKPKDRDNAKYMLQVAAQGSVTGTAFCVQKMVFKGQAWHNLDRQIGYAEGWTLIEIPQESMDFYLDRVDFMNLSGAIKIRGLAEQFTKEIRGSYSAIMGMPMYELRIVLARMGFFE